MHIPGKSRIVILEATGKESPKRGGGGRYSAQAKAVEVGLTK